LRPESGLDCLACAIFARQRAPIPLSEIRAVAHAASGHPAPICLACWEGYHKSRRCSRGTYPESYITKYTSIRRKTLHARSLTPVPAPEIRAVAHADSHPALVCSAFPSSEAATLIPTSPLIPTSHAEIRVVAHPDSSHQALISSAFPYSEAATLIPTSLAEIRAVAHSDRGPPPRRDYGGGYHPSHVLNLRTTTSQKCAAVPRRARI